MTAVRHDAAAHRFVAEVDGQQAVLDYRLEGDTLAIVHTGVPEAIGGRGIAGDLVRTAADHARAQGLKVAPRCAYAAAWFARHPDMADLVA